MSRRARVRSVAAVAAAVLALLPVAAAAQPEAWDLTQRRAQDRQTDDRVATLRVEQLTGVLTPGADLQVRVVVRNVSDEPLENPRLNVALYGPTFNRFQYQQGVEQGLLPATAHHSFTVNVAELDAGESQVVQLRQTAAQLGFARPRNLFGVYLLRLQLQERSEVLDEVVTSTVLSPAEVSQPVSVAVVAPLDADPVRLPDGSYASERIGATLSPGGRLHGILTALTLRPDVPVTVATSGLLLEQAADLSDGFLIADADGLREADPDTGMARQAEAFLATLATTLERPEVEHLALPYGPADLVALTRGGLASEAIRLVTEGNATSEALTGVPPTAGLLWPPDGLDVATVAQLPAALRRTLLLPEEHLTTPPLEVRDLTPSPVRRLRGSVGAAATVLVPDPWLEQVLEPTAEALRHGRAVAAQRVLGETAAIYFEQPGADNRGILLLPPQRWTPSPGLVGALLDATATAPWLDPVTLSGLVATVTPQPGTVQLGYPDAGRQRELPAEYVATMAQARTALGSFALVVPDDDTPSWYDRLLLQAAAVAYRDPARRSAGEDLIGRVLDTVGNVYGGVTIPQTPAVTLTSEEGQIPVTVRNGSDTSLLVRVVLEARFLEFPDGDVVDLVLEPNSARTLLFQARTLTPGGTTPVTVTVEDPIGSMQLATGLVVVRTTAYSVAALVVTGGAALFLLGWVVMQVARRRNGHAAVPEATDTPTPVG
jgi:hypothetical protein